jgi:hypothetical protein
MRNENELVQSILSRFRTLSLSGEMATADVCKPFLDFLVDRFSCVLAEVWTVAPRGNSLILVTQHHSSAVEHIPPQRVDILDKDSLTSMVLETKEITHFRDLNNVQSDGRRFQDGCTRDALGLSNMYSVPILNTTNPHQVLCVINFFPTNAADDLLQGDLGALRFLSRLVAVAIECNLRERCLRMANMLSQAMSSIKTPGPPPGLTDACSILARNCSIAISARACSVYFFDANRQALKSVVTYYDSNQDGRRLNPQKPSQVVVDTYETNREKLSPRIEVDNSPLRWASADTWSDSVAQLSDSCITVPLQDQNGSRHGVIECVRSAGTEAGLNETRFTYDHIAILEALCQAFLPSLKTLVDNERQQSSLKILTHELYRPTVNLAALLDKLKAECKENGWKFRHAHFQEATIYCDLMTRLLEQLRIGRYGPANIDLVQTSTDILTEVIYPAVRFTRDTMAKRGIFPHQFEITGFEIGSVDRHKVFPKLTVDPALLTQVVFNILDNAIKFYSASPDTFRCQILGKVSGSWWEIVISDNGPGIEAADAERIFEYGERGSGAKVFGEGLGMWIARGIARRHGGDLTLDKPNSKKWVTSFALKLPRGVRIGP